MVVGAQLLAAASDSVPHSIHGPINCAQIRVGVHTGPLASSTLGFKRNCLTLVGDTLVREAAAPDEGSYCVYYILHVLAETWSSGRGIHGSVPADV